MKILQSIADFRPDGRYLAVVLGNFDGVHLGHAELIRQAENQAQKKNGLLMLLSFWPHPLSLLGGTAPPLLTDRAEKYRLAEGLGVDYFLELPFSKSLAAKTPKQFIEEYPAHGLAANLLAVGFNFRFGAGGAGDVAALRALAAGFGIETLILPPFQLGGKPVSSSRIRSLLAAGELRAANRLLGHSFSLGGRVVEGNRLGRTLGFPTANIEVAPYMQLPAYGVYAARAQINGAELPAVVNIGLKPTVGDFTVPTVEAHLPGFNGNLYGAEMRLNFVAEIRGERKFAGLPALKKQIAADAERALAILSAK